jgi:parallel beta-helix repeat protein
MTTFNVSDSAGLSSALQAATGGDLILLESGNYGDVSIKNFNPAGVVQFRSADSANLAHFDTLAIRTSQNISFGEMTIGRPLGSAEGNSTKMGYVTGSSNITFNDVHFQGSLDGNPQNDGMGLMVSASKSINVVNSSFHDLDRGLYVEKSSFVRISGNNVHDIAVDGMDIAGTSHISIEGNTFDRFFPGAGAHPDAIQFFNTNMPSGSTDITIQNNMMLQTAGTGPQGIFLADAMGMPYTNVLIANNLLYGNGLGNGITVSGAKDVILHDNSVLSTPADTTAFWIRLQDIDGVQLVNNVADDFKYLSGLTNVIESSNTDLSDSTAIREQFANLLAPSSWEDLVIPGHGYDAPKQPVGAAVSSALGAGVGSLLGGLNYSQDLGSKHTVALPPASLEAGQTGPHLSEAFASHASVSLVHLVPSHVEMPFWQSVRYMIEGSHFAIA